jgi:APA family basic amino acid/polyamine antiporter
VGFAGGWVSATVGFAAPTALAAMALGKYTAAVFPIVDKTLIAVAVLGIVTWIHGNSLRAGSRFQDIFTLIKLLLVVFFIGAAAFAETTQPIRLMPQPGDFRQLLSPAFAVSLIYVSYAYTGWNAAAYITGEMRDPKRNLPRALFRGTLAVMLLYVLLNFSFLLTSPIPDLAGQEEVGYISAVHIFGQLGGSIMGIIISLLLVSTVSAMVLAGPRVLMVIGEDFGLFSFLSVKKSNGVPARAIYFQSAISLAFILTGSFERVLVFAGFVLAVVTFLTVMGVFVLRRKAPDLPRPYRTWGYPVTPLVFLVLVGWTLAFLLVNKPVESLAGLAIIAAGLGAYPFSRRLEQAALPRES